MQVTLTLKEADMKVNSWLKCEDLVVTVADDECVGEDQLPDHHALFQGRHAALLQPVVGHHHRTVVVQNHHRIGLRAERETRSTQNQHHEFRSHS
ncbi:hypothetical protein EYF80_059964 [Liparis tanakae]|uniref:Uncharacterized protein n=1 Tax=Liparis tanakae TaxID=230148 RepID=A0A4Z2ELQ5_9TELE|nr:hypothetical protein EYF80_059964 [Liparis tanakae]